MGSFPGIQIKLSVIDDGVTVYHPESTGYSDEKAETDMWHWANSIPSHEFNTFFYRNIEMIRNGTSMTFSYP